MVKSYEMSKLMLWIGILIVRDPVSAAGQIADQTDYVLKNL